MPRSLSPLLRITAWTLFSVALGALAAELSLSIFTAGGPVMHTGTRAFALIFTLVHGLQQLRQQPTAAVSLALASLGLFGVITLAFDPALFPAWIAWVSLLLGMGGVLMLDGRLNTGADRES